MVFRIPVDELFEQLKWDVRFLVLFSHILLGVSLFGVSFLDVYTTGVLLSCTDSMEANPFVARTGLALNLYLSFAVALFYLGWVPYQLVSRFRLEYKYDRVSKRDVFDLALLAFGLFLGAVLLLVRVWAVVNNVSAMGLYVCVN